MRMDKAHWPRWFALAWLVAYAFRCQLVLLPGLFDASESAAYLVEVALGRYSSGLITEWGPSDDFDHDDAAASLTGSS